MSTELTIHNPNQTGVLQRVGTPQEREYLIQIMAEQIGIPADDANRTDVIALLAAAAQRTLQYGWIPGIHLHVQKFETARSKEARKKNSNLRPVYSYTLVDGEKAWKDSGTRWRERGVQWKYQRSAMTLAEVREEARLQGYSEALAPNAYGMWSRIVVLGQDDPNDPDNPIWSAGVYFGKIKSGDYWRVDTIPTGVSTRDIAIRRADKRAMMQSTLTLLPVNDLAPEERLHQLVDNLRREGEGKERMARVVQPPDRVQIEADGDMLWASPNARPRAAQPRFAEEDFAMGEGIFHAEPSEEDDAPIEADARIVEDEPPPGARPEASPQPAAARPTASDRAPETPVKGPINTSDGPCPECHAPVGKVHASSCPIAKESPGARPEPSPSEVAARPQASPEASGARPTASGARPTASDRAPEDNLIVAVARMADSWEMTPELKELVRKTRNSDHDSAMKMSDAYLTALIAMLHGELPTTDDEEALWVISALVGYPVSRKTRPGQFVHTHLIKPLRNQDAATLTCLREALEACRQIVIAEIEGSEAA